MGGVAGSQEGQTEVIAGDVRLSASGQHPLGAPTWTEIGHRGPRLRPRYWSQEMTAAGSAMADRNRSPRRV
jgi:hypothetical protein